MNFPVPLAQAAELCAQGCSRTYTHHSKWKKKKMQNNFQITHFTHYVLQVSFSWSSASLFFAKQNQDYCFLLLFLRECVQSYGKHCELWTQEHPKNTEGLPWSQSKPPLLPQAASQFPWPYTRVPSSPWEWLCKPCWVSVPLSWGIYDTQQITNNSFSCWVSNPKVREQKLKKKNHFALMQSSTFPCFLGKR